MPQWEKLGRVLEANNTNPYLLSHLANPLAIHLSGDHYRIFYNGRNAQNKSSIGFIDLNILTQQVIVYPKEPVITFGNTSSFYSHGLSLGCSYEVGGKQYILCMGWHYPNEKHWQGNIGRLCLTNGQWLKVDPAKPFLSIDQVDEISLSYPCIVFHEGIYKMWYGSTLAWNAGNNEMLHVIKYATSLDGTNWEKHGIAIPYEIGVAQAFSRPTVIIHKEVYHMWFSYRGGANTQYRIGYALSDNGQHWQRKEAQAGITVSAQGWDSEMLCYPHVFKHAGNFYMLYNGNSYGKTGMGLAVLKSWEKQ